MQPRTALLASKALHQPSSIAARASRRTPATATRAAPFGRPAAQRGSTAATATIAAPACRRGAGAFVQLRRAASHLARSSSSMAEAPAGGAGARGDASEGEGSEAGGQRLRKRTVALHVAYVGTNFYGLQANRELPELATVEGVLEQALFDAGMISPSNFGDFRKTKWARSSRTDKGVHSLCTVIGVRLLVEDGRFVSDPEGIGYAREISGHLPPSVRVLAVQRTTKKFNVRRWCLNRTYEYYLPVTTLGLASPDGRAPGDAERLALFRAALQQYVGNRPFHNFAGDRKQYVKGDKGSKAAREEWAAQEAERRRAREAAAGAAAEEQAEADAEQGPTAAAGAAVGQEPSAAGAAGATSGSEEDEEARGDEADVGGRRVWVQTLRWLEDPDPKDPVVMSHYRRILSFSADDPRPLVEGGVPCLRLEVKGDSFMLNQIRNMIGTAVAVSQGRMSLDLLTAALSAPCRIHVPRAPPHTLLLSGNDFSDFAKSWGVDAPAVAQYSGDKLALREGGRAEQGAFRAEVFDRAINGLLSHPDWAYWNEDVLPRYHYPPEATAALIAKHQAWRAEVVARRAAEAAAKEAAAARKEAEAAAAAAEQQVQQQEEGQAVAQGSGGGGGGILGMLSRMFSRR